MDFTIPKNATPEEIEDIIERGMDAMMDAVDSGAEGNVAFLHAGSPEAEAARKKENASGTTDGRAGDDDIAVNNNNKKEVDENEETCVECGESPCVFFKHEELLVLFDDTEHGATCSTEPIPSNNVRRKKLYRQLTLMLNGGPLGEGVRKPLPSCCVSAIRDMLPSETFMGFKAE
jgi:hypothetical protein